MKSFLYIQVKYNSKSYENNLIDCEGINSIHKDKISDTDREIILIVDKQDNKMLFVVDDILHVVTDNKYIANFFRGVGIEVELEGEGNG